MSNEWLNDWRLKWKTWIVIVTLLPCAFSVVITDTQLVCKSTGAVFNLTKPTWRYSHCVSYSAESLPALARHTTVHTPRFHVRSVSSTSHRDSASWCDSLAGLRTASDTVMASWLISMNRALKSLSPGLVAPAYHSAVPAAKAAAVLPGFSLQRTLMFLIENGLTIDAAPDAVY